MLTETLRVREGNGLLKQLMPRQPGCRIGAGQLQWKLYTQLKLVANAVDTASGREAMFCAQSTDRERYDH